MDKAKAKEIFSDAVFVTSLLKLETAEEAQKALKARGLEVSLDDLQAIGDGLEKAAENGGKLSEDDLEKVAGGFRGGSQAGHKRAMEDPWGWQMRRDQR